MPVVGGLSGGVDRPTTVSNSHRAVEGRLDVDGVRLVAPVGQPGDGEGLLAGEAQRVAVCPSGNCSGSTPMPIRLERWMRSKDSAMTARTPSSVVPLAAQSRDDPEPYSLPARIDQRGAVGGVAHRRRRRSWSSARRRVKSRVKPPSVPGASWLRSRMLANVPRIITSWLPRRDP